MADVANKPQNLTFQNLHAENMVCYGMFFTGTNQPNPMDEEKAVHVLIDGCSVALTQTGHGFRWNADDVTVRNCSAYNLHSTGLWAQGGNRDSNSGFKTSIDGFASNRRMAVGPDRAGPSDGNPNEYLRNFFAQRVRLGGTGDLDQNNAIIEMGTCGACLVNDCIGKLEIGRPQSNLCQNYAYFNKPLNHANWDSLNWTAQQNCQQSFNLTCLVITPISPLPPPDCGNSMMGAACLPLPDPYNIGYQGEMGLVIDGTVNIDDLLAVINAWGNCPELPDGVATGPRPPCPADISPSVCGDSVVNIDDLLAVINHWGPCPNHPMCGLMPPTQEEGPPESAPQSISDCWHKCSNAFPADEAAWLRCFDDCVEALQRAGLIPY